MKKLLFAYGLVFMTLLVTSARATRYAYSYEFLSGAISTASGSFSGTLNGDLIEDLHDITLFHDGVKIEGLIQAASFSSSYLVVPGATASFDVTKNNFILANDDPFNPGPATQFFWIAYGESIAGSVDGTISYSKPLDQSVWSLHEIPEGPVVPDTTAALPLLISSLLGLLVVRRRS